MVEADVSVSLLVGTSLFCNNLTGVVLNRKTRRKVLQLHQISITLRSQAKNRDVESESTKKRTQSSPRQDEHDSH